MGGCTGSDDSDFGIGFAVKRRPKKAKGAAKLPKKRVADLGDVELTASGRRRRKDAGVKWKAHKKARGWTDDEQRLFEEALELHGRGDSSVHGHDWKKVRVCLLGGVSGRMSRGGQRG